MRRKIWRVLGQTPTITEQDAAETEAAERDVEHRKQRGEAMYAEVKHVVEKNHLAEKFHAAFNVKRSS